MTSALAIVPISRRQSARGRIVLCSKQVSVRSTSRMHQRQVSFAKAKSTTQNRVLAHQQNKRTPDGILLFWQPLKDAICNPELPFEIISEILKPILDRHGYTPVLMTYAAVK